MKRPIVVAIIGYIIGIIVGLYLQISIAPFCILIIVTDIIYKRILKNKRKHQKLKLFSIKRYFIIGYIERVRKLLCQLCQCVNSGRPVPYLPRHGLKTGGVTPQKPKEKKRPIRPQT